MSERERLENVAYAVADECRDGKFAHIPPWPAEEHWAALCAEVEKRCPGFTSQEYSDALNDGFVASR